MTTAAKRLYYYTGKRWAMKALWERRLKIARYQDVNEPFELLPCDLTDADARAFWTAAAERFVAARHGVLCFSEDWRSSLMWSHYGEKHTGLCLGFDVPADLAAPIVYVESRLRQPERPAEALRDAGDDVLEAALRHKHVAWRHEREWRLRAELGEPTDGVHYKHFDDELHLREVIVGVRCSLSAADVEGAVSSPPMDVEIFHADAARDAFEIHRHLEVAPRTVRGYRARLALARDVYADEFPDDEPAV